MSRSYGPERIRVDRRTRPNRWRLEIYNPVPGVPKIIPPTLNIDQVDCLLCKRVAHSHTCAHMRTVEGEFPEKN
jgi:hypothetical protein